MTELVWNATGTRLYETGVSKVVLYPRDGTGAYPMGYAWNGVTQISESPSGAEANPFYADNIKYLNLISREEFAASLEAYTYPDEFAECDGSKEAVAGVKISQQTRKPFGLCYRTELGNDVLGEDYGYQLHLIYYAMAAPSEKAHDTINESPEAATMSWEISTTPEPVTGMKPTSHIIIDSTKADPTALLALEAELYGTEIIDPNLPLPDEVVTLLTV